MGGKNYILAPKSLKVGPSLFPLFFLYCCSLAASGKDLLLFLLLSWLPWENGWPQDLANLVLLTLTKPVLLRRLPIRMIAQHPLPSNHTWGSWAFSTSTKSVWRTTDQWEKRWSSLHQSKGEKNIPWREKDRKDLAKGVVKKPRLGRIFSKNKSEVNSECWH